SVDSYDASRKAIWDFKHIDEKVRISTNPTHKKQLEDYIFIRNNKVVGSNGLKVDKVNYLLPNKAAAEYNKNLLKFDVNIYYITGKNKIVKFQNR
ncbi:hypothetical protein, partial [Microscilla marina]|uniref:hypothetical protein n=1 Tax=Microscilla marina TaxID=1027 RepID=UPI0005D46D3C